MVFFYCISSNELFKLNWKVALITGGGVPGSTMAEVDPPLPAGHSPLEFSDTNYTN
jgi:hypothetical protein